MQTEMQTMEPGDETTAGAAPTGVGVGGVTDRRSDRLEDR
jgi:hypothetical protein